MEYNFSELEPKWQQFWQEKNTYKVDIQSDKPKFYVLDMFPYPSGAGLHVGHPLGYIASDIFARYKRHCGFNVLHPMGYDAFGLPAEQYAIQTGQHPAVTTENNIKRYRQQLDKIGFCYDWSREVRTCDPKYYKWTQWAFIQMFNHWYNNDTQKAEPIEKLIEIFETEGNMNVNAACNPTPKFYESVWKGLTEIEKQDLLLNYRLAYLADTMVNWCPPLGTVLANDEVKDGSSVRGGHPVEQKVMRQWLIRVTAYAERLLRGLDTIEWTDSLKEMQRNWINRSEGAEINFSIVDSQFKLLIFTTRPDTIFGATFMVLAPEHELVMKITTTEYEKEVQQYIDDTKKRTERDRLADAKKITGMFTGAYAVNPFTNTQIPIWISEYVLSGYGTGAIMAVPAHDSRDYAFAKHFGLPIIQVVEGGDISEQAFESKDGVLMNSDFINGLKVKEAILKINDQIEERELGKRKINYRLRDAIFSRQRYWGEPFPIFYKDGCPVAFDESELPLELPEVDKFLPTETGEPPLARAASWYTSEGHKLETATMPGFAGSSAYYLRYMDPHNEDALVSKEADEYWQDVDLYVGGTEHATGHLIYSRFWNKFLFDIGIVCKDEPFRKLINQGMIQGRSNFVYRVSNHQYASWKLWDMLKEGQTGIKFERDYRIHDHIFNFCTEEYRLAIEISSQKSAKEFFETHNKPLKNREFKLLMVTPEELVLNPEALVEKIKRICIDKEEFENSFSEEVQYSPIFVSLNLLREEFQATPLHVDVNIVSNDQLDLDKFRAWRSEFENALFVTEDGKYVCGWAVEKMSKTYYNVVTPDVIIEQYGADTLRLYEMFLGPVELSKPWDTNGIEGVHRFLRKVWNLYHDKEKGFKVTNVKANKDELKLLHRLTKKIREDIEDFSYNTSVSAFMIFVNEMQDSKCNKRDILEPFCILLAPFVPHLAEELWQKLGHETSVCDAVYPTYEESYLIDDSFMYPITFNGKKRFEMKFSTKATEKHIIKTVLEAPESQKYLDGKTPKKVIVVAQKIVNVVL